MANRLQIIHSTAYEIIQNRLRFHGVCARWVQKWATVLHIRSDLHSYQQHLDLFGNECNAFLEMSLMRHWSPSFWAGECVADGVWSLSAWRVEKPAVHRKTNVCRSFGLMGPPVQEHHQDRGTALRITVRCLVTGWILQLKANNKDCCPQCSDLHSPYNPSLALSVWTNQRGIKGLLIHLGPRSERSGACVAHCSAERALGSLCNTGTSAVTSKGSMLRMMLMYVSCFIYCYIADNYWLTYQDFTKNCNSKIWGFHGGDCEGCRPLWYKNPVHTSQETHYSTTESSQLMLLRFEVFIVVGWYAMWLL
jgi:hypothetical protein